MSRGFGASGEIRTLKHLFLRQPLFQFAHAGTWCTGEDLNLRVPLGETGLQPVRFGRAHAPVQTWRKVDESNVRRSTRRPGFQDQLPTIQQCLPRWRRVRESNPLASNENPCLADKCLNVRPTLRELSKNDLILVGPVGVEPTKGAALEAAAYASSA